MRASACVHRQACIGRRASACLHRQACIRMLASARGTRRGFSLRASAAQVSSSSGSRCGGARGHRRPGVKDGLACRTTRLATTAPQAPFARTRHRVPCDAPARSTSAPTASAQIGRGSGTGHGERERARRPSRVVRRASPIATQPAGCPRAMAHRDPQAGGCALRAHRHARPLPTSRRRAARIGRRLRTSHAPLRCPCHRALTRIRANEARRTDMAAQAMCRHDRREPSTMSSAKPARSSLPSKRKLRGERKVRAPQSRMPGNARPQ